MFMEKFHISNRFFRVEGYNIRIMRKIILFTAKSLSVLLVIWWFAFVILSHGFSLVTLIESFIPLIILAAAIVAWGNPKYGGYLFILLGLTYIMFAWGVMDLKVYFFVAGPLILTGLLFLFSELLKTKS